MLLYLFGKVSFPAFIYMVTVWVPSILLALTVHECAHALVSYLRGDPTAANAGRISLNPLAHLDPVGTVFLLSGVIGWGKPVPVDPRNLKNPRRDILWIALAGPATNILLALSFGIGLRFLQYHFSQLIFVPRTLPWYLNMFFAMGIILNFGLAFFNLLPLFPLDGSNIVLGLLPPEKAFCFYQHRQYGLYLLIFLIALGFFSDFNPLFSYITLLSNPLSRLLTHLSIQELFNIIFFSIRL